MYENNVSSEISPIENTVVDQPTTGALQRLEAEALAMDKAYRVASALSKTEMVPEHFQQRSVDRATGEPRGEAAAWNLAAAILYGAELGLSAVQAAQNVFVVKGKPAVYARTMAAQVRRAGYRIEEVEADDQHVVWRGERDGKWFISEWTIDRAKQAGYTSNQKYTSNPQEMLRAKAIAEVCRIAYQDVLLGMGYSLEELQLDSVSVQRVVKREPRGAAALRDIAAKATDIRALSDVTDEPAQPGEPVVHQVPAEEPTGVAVVDPECLQASDEQVEKIRKIYHAKDIKGQAILDDVVAILCREEKLGSLSKLSVAEAEVVLEVLLEPTV